MISRGRWFALGSAVLTLNVCLALERAQGSVIDRETEHAIRGGCWVDNAACTANNGMCNQICAPVGGCAKTSWYKGHSSSCTGGAANLFLVCVDEPTCTYSGPDPIQTCRGGE
jgi:hypothetical protein